MTEQRLQGGDRARTRIMIIDDEPKIRHFLKEALEMREYEVLTAASGPDGLEQLKHEKVSLILLDVMMPVMNGYEVYHLLKETPQTANVPVIIVTAKGERKDRELGLEAASYNYVAKPFQLEDLLAKVRDVLQQQSVQR
jgi:DNA-binding response OmpR family regulator